jgi:catecholate siderophore receptor
MPSADHAPDNRIQTQTHLSIAVMPGERFPVRATALAVSMAVSGTALSQTAPADTALLPTVEVIDFRGKQMSSPKYSRELKDTPRLVTVMPRDLIEEQGSSSLRDALKNVPGISLQAGEGNPPSGDQFKIRGFNARDDINVNGVRDLGNYFRDPFYVEQLEVVKGPNSAFSGRGSAGGTVNFATKLPLQKDVNRLELSLGTDDYYRTTLDMNKVLSDNSAVRLNVMGHKADFPGRDIAEESRYGLYAAYTWGFQGPTRVTADYLHLKLDDIQDAGLPMDRQNLLGNGPRVPEGINYNNFYGHTNDYKKVQVDQFGLALRHALSGGTVLKNQLRLSRVHNDGWVSSPRISTAANPGGLNPEGLDCSVAPCVRGETKPRDQVDLGINNQTDALFNFKTGSVEHDLVTGLELARYSYENDRRRDTRGPWTRLYNPSARTLPPHQVIGGVLFGLPVYDGTTYKLVTQEVGVYVLDTMKLSERWDLHAGLRWDKVKATATRRGFDGVNGPTTNNTTHERKDDEVSYNLGLVYKLDPKTSIYGAFGNAYVMSANFDRNNVQLAGGSATEAIVGAGFDSPPEQVRAFELGVKRQLARSLDLGAAIFRTDVTKGRVPAQAPGLFALPNNKYYIQGFEVLAAGDITREWKLYAGYTYLQNKITAAPSAGADENFVKGQKLGNTPKHAFTLFTTYDLTSQFTVGGGAQRQSRVTSGVDTNPNDNVYTVSVDGYTVWDLYAAYKFNKQTQLRLNLLNVTDERYISQLADGGSQGIPGRGRQAILTLRHDF